MTTDTHPGASLAQEVKVAAAAQAALPQRNPRRAEQRVRLRQRDADPRRGEGRGEHGCRRRRRDAKLINGAVNDLALITGQKPEIRKATKSIAQFKLREGMPIGARVTLRGDRMWEFLDRLVSIALPRTRDFRGLSAKQFDGHGNYTFGLAEQSVFHEIDVDSIDRPRGMDITVVTTATNDDEGRALLRALGFPFKEN